MYIDYENDIKEDDENKIVRVKKDIPNNLCWLLSFTTDEARAS